jgi:hypothetical protein
MKYDLLDFNVVLEEKVNEDNNEIEDVEINITSEEYLSSITEEQLERSYEFNERINEHLAKAISDAYNYVVF